MGRLIRHPITAIAVAQLFLLRAPLEAQSALSAPATDAGDWAGLQIGVESGYGQGRADAILSDPAPTHAHNVFGRTDGGLELGYNRMLGSRLVLGASADIAFPYFY